MKIFQTDSPECQHRQRPVGLVAVDVAHRSAPEVVPAQLPDGRGAQHVRIQADGRNVIVHEIAIQGIQITEHRNHNHNHVRERGIFTRFSPHRERIFSAADIRGPFRSFRGGFFFHPIFEIIIIPKKTGAAKGPANLFRTRLARKRDTTRTGLRKSRTQIRTTRRETRVDGKLATSPAKFGLATDGRGAKPRRIRTPKKNHPGTVLPMR